MGNTIAILDDEPERIAAMAPLLRTRFSDYFVCTLGNAPDFIEWLRVHLVETALICLDHDLGPNRTRDGVPFDPGTGRDVADFLADQSPACPVIIHSTNGYAVPGMIRVLEDSRWTCRRVIPDSQLAWIKDWWYPEVVRLLG